MEIGPALLLAPLVGGYAFATLWFPSRYRSARESGHRLYFRAAFYGAWLVAIAVCVHILAYVHWPGYRSLVGLVGAFAGPESAAPGIHDSGALAAVLLWPLFLGPFLGVLLSFPRLTSRLESLLPAPLYARLRAVPPISRVLGLLEEAERRVLEDAVAGRKLEQLILRAYESALPILFTLDTGKVYAGWVIDPPDPTSEPTYLRILPAVSGYRDQADQRVVLTTEYEWLIEAIQEGADATAGEDGYPDVSHLSAEDLMVVLPAGRVVSAHLIDLVAYRHFEDRAVP